MRKEDRGLQRLEELTRALPLFTCSDLVKRTERNRVEWRVEGGTVIGYGLKKNSRIAVQDAFLSRGAITAEHVHENKEWVIVYEGRVAFTVNGSERILSAGEAIDFDPGTPHGSRVLEDSWVISVTIPAEEAYPDAP